MTMGKLIQVDFASRSGKRQPVPGHLSYDSIAKLQDYQLTFSRGWLRAGRMYRRLTPVEAGDLSEGLYCALMSSMPGKPSTCESVPGLVIVGEHPSVQVRGMGPPIKGEALHDLILELKNFYMRRRNRGAR